MLATAETIMSKYFGFDSFRDQQEKVIESILKGKDTIAIMPTGSGKSICFQIPALMFPGVTIVISPLISLMKDQVDALRDIGIPATFINSSLGYSDIQNRLEKLEKGEYKLLYIAPERLDNRFFLEILNSLYISFVAIDESHCVSQWGHDFRPSYLNIKEIIDNIKTNPIIAAFTATATPRVKEDIIKFLGLSTPNVFLSSFDRPNLEFKVIKGTNKDAFVFDYLSNNKKESGIIYAATRRTVDKINDYLNKKGFKAGRYHGGLSDLERKRTQEDFINDDINIVVATNAFGMGIDKSNVRYVIHYNMPKNIEAYYQEAGRAGRDGEPGECILLYTPRDKRIQKFLISNNQTTPEIKKMQLKKLKQMIEYCHTSNCLRSYILSYFGERNTPPTCDNCSNCSDKKENMVDITTEALKIISCIVHMKERWGATTVAQVLVGSKSKKIINNDFQNLSTYGIINKYTIKELKKIIDTMAADGYISMTGGKYPVVKLNSKSYRVLNNEIKVYQHQHLVKKEDFKLISNNQLFEKLRTLRKKLSTEEGVPPYVVFSDSALQEMSVKYPTDKVNMLKIKGVGEIKFEKYGSKFIEVIERYIEENKVNVDDADEAGNTNSTGNEKAYSVEKIRQKHPNAYAKWTEDDDELLINLYEKGEIIKDLAEKFGRNKGAIRSRIRKLTENSDITKTNDMPKNIDMNETKRKDNESKENTNVSHKKEQKPGEYKVEYNSKTYIWTGKFWHDKYYVIPCLAIVEELNKRLEKIIEKDDDKIENLNELLKRAQNARDNMQYERALKLARRVIEKNNNNQVALSIICSILRKKGEPENALTETRRPNIAYTALLTSRAAAYCDIGEWEKAKNEVGRALTIKKTGEAFSVVNRIKKKRPDLY